MSIDHILTYIKDRMEPVDLIEKLEPYITIEELAFYLSDVIKDNYTEVFEEELEEYYGTE